MRWKSIVGDKSRMEKGEEVVIKVTPELPYTLLFEGVGK
jgi:hypothetical protein